MLAVENVMVGGQRFGGPVGGLTGGGGMTETGGAGPRMGLGMGGACPVFCPCACGTPRSFSMCLLNGLHVVVFDVLLSATWLLLLSYHISVTMLVV